MRNLLSIFNFKSRDPLAGILVFVAAVVAVEGFWAFHPNLVAWPGIFVIRPELPNRSPDLQVMGDSVAAWGILAPELSEALPGHPSVVNMAGPGTGPEFLYFILEREIAAGKTPRAVLYAPSPHNFRSGRIPLLVGNFCSWPEIWQVAREGVSPSEVVYGLFCKFSYTLRFRDQLMEILLAKKPVVRAAPAKGASPKTAPAVKTWPSFTDFPREFRELKNPFQVRRSNLVFLEKFLALARENHVKIYWTPTPVRPFVHNYRVPLHFDAEYFQFLEELRARYGVEIFEREYLVYPDELFQDFVHLNAEGSRRFTEHLAGELMVAQKPF